MGTIEPPNSNIPRSQPSSHRSFKLGSYHLGPRHRNVYWKTPALAIFFFMVGVVLAVSHHIYLSSLDRNPDTNQSWIGRFSLAFAFSTKTCFAAVAAISMRQVLWYTFRRTSQGISISAIDSFFEIQQNPLAFLRFDIWYLSIPVTIFAIFLWLLPLISLVSPTSLSTTLTSIMVTDSGCIVPNLNFSPSGTFQPGISLADGHGTDGVHIASPMAQKLSFLTAYNGEILSWPSPCGSNCSYDLRFNGPAWRCTDSAIDNSSAIAPFGGAASNVWGTKIGGIHYPSYLAAFSNETGLFWVGRSTQNLDSKTTWPTLNISVFYCENWNATFDIRVDYESSIQTVALRNISYLNNVSIPYVLETASSNGKNTIYIPSEYYEPSHYTHAALFRSLGELMLGSIVREPYGVPVLSTKLASIPGLISFNETSALTDGHYQPVANLRSAVEELSRNLSISLLSSPVLQIASNTTTTCYNKTFRTVWVYNAWILWLPYGLAMSLSAVCLFVGGLAVLGNGGQTYDNSFSTILRTTRNQELDKLVESKMSGEQPLRHGLGKTKVRFGNFRGDESAALDKQEGTFVIVQ